MAEVDHLYQLLRGGKGSQSVVLGFPCELTLKMLETYGLKALLIYGHGNDHELDWFEMMVESVVAGGKGVHEVWCQGPSNPLLRVPGSLRLTKLAKYYRFVLIVGRWHNWNF